MGSKGSREDAIPVSPLSGLNGAKSDIPSIDSLPHTQSGSLDLRPIMTTPGSRCKDVLAMPVVCGASSGRQAKRVLGARHERGQGRGVHPPLLERKVAFAPIGWPWLNRKLAI